ncbi:unnamed protein product [Pedinophyceae sp. YPF-701]|nr:unnamed protein product [Pedinophyceae sp. YPF-701]
MQSSSGDSGPPRRRTPRRRTLPQIPAASRGSGRGESTAAETGASVRGGMRGRRGRGRGGGTGGEIDWRDPSTLRNPPVEAALLARQLYRLERTRDETAGAAEAEQQTREKRKRGAEKAADALGRSPGRSKSRKVDDAPVCGGGGGCGGCGCGCSGAATGADAACASGSAAVAMDEDDDGRSESGRSACSDWKPGDDDAAEDVCEDLLDLLDDDDLDDGDLEEEIEIRETALEVARDPAAVRAGEAWGAKQRQHLRQHCATMSDGERKLAHQKIDLAVRVAPLKYGTSFASDVAKGRLEGLKDLPPRGELARLCVPVIAREIYEQLYLAVPAGSEPTARKEWCVPCVHSSAPLALEAPWDSGSLYATLERLDAESHVEAFLRHDRDGGVRAFGFAAFELNVLQGQSTANFTDAGGTAEYLFLSSPPRELAEYIRAQLNPYYVLCQERPELRRVIKFTMLRHLRNSYHIDRRRLKRPRSVLARAKAALGARFRDPEPPSPQHVDRLVRALVDRPHGWLCPGSPDGIAPVVMHPPGSHGKLGYSAPGAQYVASLDATDSGGVHSSENTQYMSRAFNLAFKNWIAMVDGVKALAVLAGWFVARDRLPADMYARLFPAGGSAQAVVLAGPLAVPSSGEDVPDPKDISLPIPPPSPPTPGPFGDLVPMPRLPKFTEAQGRLLYCQMLALIRCGLEQCNNQLQRQLLVSQYLDDESTFCPHSPHCVVNVPHGPWQCALLAVVPASQEALKERRKQQKRCVDCGKKRIKRVFRERVTKRAHDGTRALVKDASGNDIWRDRVSREGGRGRCKLCYERWWRAKKLNREQPDAAPDHGRHGFEGEHKHRGCHRSARCFLPMSLDGTVGHMVCNEAEEDLISPEEFQKLRAKWCCANVANGCPRSTYEGAFPGGRPCAVKMMPCGDHRRCNPCWKVWSNPNSTPDRNMHGVRPEPHGSKLFHLPTYPERSLAWGGGADGASAGCIQDGRCCTYAPGGFHENQCAIEDCLRPASPEALRARRDAIVGDFVCAKCKRPAVECLEDGLHFYKKLEIKSQRLCERCKHPHRYPDH